MQVLDLHNVPEEKMKTFNVLADQELRNGIKEFSWVFLLLSSWVKKEKADEVTCNCIVGNGRRFRRYM